MSCTLTVTSAVYDPNTGKVVLSGTIIGETCTLFNISVACGSTAFSGTGAQILGTIDWNGQVPVTGCSCNGQITIIVTCSTDPTCTITVTFPSLCCCPSASTAIVYGPCTGSQELITFNTLVTISDSCTWTFRRNFGNGNFGANHTFTGPGTFTIPAENSLFNAPGSYTSTLDVINPYGCGAASSVTVNASCAACHTHPLLGSLCKALGLLFILSTSVGLTLLINYPSCTSLAIALGFVAVGAAALVVYLLLKCQKCDCDPIPKFLAQIFIIMGIIMFEFVPPPACSVITGGLALLSAITLLGIGFVALNTWYNNNKTGCGLKSCDFWCAIAGIFNPYSCTTIAGVGAIIIFVATLSVKFAGLGLVGIVIATISTIVNGGPLNTPPCKNNTSSCQ